MKKLFLFIMCCLQLATYNFLLPLYAADKGLAAGVQLLNAGQYEAAVRYFSDFVNQNPNDQQKTPEALIKLGKSLEGMSDIINTSAERVCFRSPKGLKGTPCMNAYAEQLNAQYGAGAFQYFEQLVFIKYTGVHYKQAEEKFPGGPFVAEAAFLNLSKNLVGHPDDVLPRIKDYISRHKDGQWSRAGRLLWARINEDIWWIHRRWSWILYNWQISSEELIVKAEPYRQEALRTFEALMQKEGGSAEGKAAKKEYELLKVYKDDGRLYGIINESDVEGTKAIPGHE